MSLRAQPVRNRQSAHATYAVPAASISAEGSGDSRSPPATVWWLTLDTSTVARQVAPPSMDRNERICAALVARYGTRTVPFGRTTGCPPRPVAPPLDDSAAPQVRPPFVDLLMRIPLL